MTTQERTETIAARALEEFRPLCLYADLQLLHRGAHVALARRLEARGERRFWLSLAGCALLLLGVALLLLMPGGHRHTSSFVNVTMQTWFAVRLAMNGASYRARTRMLRGFLESLLPEQVAALDGHLVPALGRR